MHSKWVFKHFHPHLRGQVRILAALWFTGLLIGILLCCYGKYDALDILHSAILTAPAPLGLFLVCILPVVFTAITLAMSWLPLTYITVFFSAVSHGFCGILIYLAHGSAAWLLRPMFLFPASCTSVLMWWLLLQNEVKGRLHKNLRLACVLSCFIYIFDLFVVSPLIGDLTKYF